MDADEHEFFFLILAVVLVLVPDFSDYEDEEED